MTRVEFEGRHYGLLWLNRIEKCRNPIWKWLQENRPGIMSVIKKLKIETVGVSSVSWERLRITYFADGRPITSTEALERGMTEEEFKDFDRQVDTDELISIFGWAICEYPLE